MTNPPTMPAAMVEIWRGDLLESQHFGHAVIVEAGGEILRSWGDPEVAIYPRSSAKMIQALPLVTSGAADRYGLGSEQLALACASHNGAAIHTDRVGAWMGQLGLSDDAFRCGPQVPDDETARLALIRDDANPCQMHNNCSGKHAGFLTLAQYMGAGPEYLEIDHPVQQAALSAFEEATAENSLGFGIDGCSAPNFATTLTGLARAMAWFAASPTRSDHPGMAAQRLIQAMAKHPELVAGEGRCCTRLMRAMQGRAVVKTGAEGVFVAIIPEKQLGLAVKITDGATRASECVITALLIEAGVLDAADPAAAFYVNAPIRNRRNLETGIMRPAADLKGTF